MSQLLLVAEFGIIRTEIRSRFEFFGDDKGRCFFGRWTCKRRGDKWLGRPQGNRKYDLTEGLTKFVQYTFETAITNDNNYLRGVATCTGVPKEIIEKTEDGMDRILMKVFRHDVNAWNETLPALFDAYVGRFREDLPRDSVGDGCWGVQLQGLRSCLECDLRNHPACIGKSMLRTGKNSVGFEIPILNHLC